MKRHVLLGVLLAATVANLALLGCLVLRWPAAEAKEEPGILRGRGLEIVDAEGRMRAQIKVEPANPDYAWPDGSRTGYPETVILRLATADGKPRVKLTTSVEGTGLMVLGSTDATYSLLRADGASASLLLRNDERTQRTVKP
jgi:hypothetical protein